MNTPLCSSKVTSPNERAIRRKQLGIVAPPTSQFVKPKPLSATSTTSSIHSNVYTNKDFSMQGQDTEMSDNPRKTTTAFFATPKLIIEKPQTNSRFQSSVSKLR